MSSVAEIIHERQDEIMKLWLDEARAAASARGLSATALENVMPMYLAALADRVDNGSVDRPDKRREAVQNHLSTRIRQGFDLAEILQEFRLLDRSISKVWQSLPQSEWPAADDIDRLHMHTNVALADVTDTFNLHMLEDEQSEKRFLRRLQAIASEALRDVHRTLRDRMRDLLDVVMEAMGAQCAAFLLFDVTDKQLVLISCAGTEVLEPYATSLDPTSFVADVAAHGEVTALYDAAAAQLRVPAALHRSGIHSLLGIRLPPNGELVGVMYVGIAEAREFTAREIRRLESLGDRLTLHLENGRLFDELQDKIMRLDVEKALRERFVATLAHDLRGPLSAARLAASLLSMEPADRRYELAVKVDYNIDRVDRMIHDLLDANRIRAGEPLPLRLGACDFVALAEQVADEARVVYGDRFAVNAVGHVRGIGSAEDLHRALWNLVTNAVKYGAPKTLITIEATHDDDVLRLSVHNEGTPIPVEEREHIFDAYSRAPSANASGRTGWGLGLTLVRGTAEAHGGRVLLTSDAASGTTFTIELPRDATTARSNESHAASPAH